MKGAYASTNHTILSIIKISLVYQKLISKDTKLISMKYQR